MLTISPPAYERLTEMLTDRPDDICVRIYLREGKAHIRPGRQRPGDRVIEHDGRSVILLDKRADRHLEKRTISTKETANGTRLRLRKVRKG